MKGLRNVVRRPTYAISRNLVPVRVNHRSRDDCWVYSNHDELRYPRVGKVIHIQAWSMWTDRSLLPGLSGEEI